jgi:signal transduction histidine kinase
MPPVDRTRQRPHALSLRHQMSLAMAAFLAVVLGLSLAFAHHILTRSAEEAAAGRLASASREVAATAGQAARLRVQQLERAAAAPEIVRLLAQQPVQPDHRDAAAALLSALGLAGERGAGVWSADGRLVAEFSPPVAAPPAMDAEPPLHGPLVATADGVSSWTVVPIVVAGRRAGWLASEMRAGGPSGAERTLAELTGEDVMLFLRNADGSVWLTPGRPPLASAPRRLDRGPAAYEVQGAGRVLAAEAAIGEAPWAVTMMAPLRDVHARARATTWRLGLASALLLGFGTLLAWAFGSAVARPLVSLAYAADALSAGDYTQRVPEGAGDEVGRLAATFNNMAAQLAASRHELVRRVQDAQLSRDEAERLRTVAEYARDHAERASRARADFLAMISHELRTPLNAIGGYTQLLEIGVHGTLNDEQQAALRRITVNQTQLLALIDEVLSYTQLERGRVEFDTEDVALGEMLERVEASIAPQLGMRNLRYTQPNVDAYVHVRADAARVQQILLNLLANAIKFTPSGGAIEVCCDVDDDTVRIHVRDTGIGIAPERLESIFEPFVQVDRTLSRPADGVGLGLAISRDLARGMAGDVRVSSRPGQGSTFTLVLPRGHATPAAAAAD